MPSIPRNTAEYHTRIEANFAYPFSSRFYMCHGVSGIYKVVHKPSGKVYIGSSVDIAARWKNHRTGLLRGKHHSVSLQETFNRDGLHSFSFVLLEQCAREDLAPKEMEWLSRYDSMNMDKGFNGQVNRHCRPIRAPRVMQAARESPINDAPVLERIASALERIAACMESTQNG